MDIFGTDGDDNLVGTTGDDTIRGLAGNDTIDGNGGADNAYGGDGDDIIYNALFAFGGSGADEIYVDYGGFGDGGDGDDLLSVSEESTVLGGAGNDRFEIDGAGNARLTGGTGVDTYAISFYDSIPTSIVTDFVVGTGGDNLDLAKALQYLEIYGYRGGNPIGKEIFRWVQYGNDVELQYDTFWFDPRNAGTWGGVMLLENVSAVQLRAENFGGYTPLPIEVHGNRIKGTVAADELIGTAGDDSVQGLAGDDVLYGELGDDILLGGAGNDILFDEGGNDRLDGGDGNDSLNDANGGLNALYGGNGNDEINLNGGFKSIVEGNAGHDTILSSDSEEVRIFGGTGNDVIKVFGSFGAYGEGGAGADEIQGGDGDDVILGGDGNDEIIGGAGADRLVGGAGGDLFYELRGASGADTFVYLATADSSGPRRNVDLIANFDVGLDRLDLAAIDAITATIDDDAFEFIGTAAFTASGQLRIGEPFGNQISLLGNTGGDFVAEFQVIFVDVTPLVSDIYL